MDEIRKIPPVTRTMVLSTLGLTVPVLLQILSPYYIVFVSRLIFSKKFEFWRLFTCVYYAHI